MSLARLAIAAISGTALMFGLAAPASADLADPSATGQESADGAGPGAKQPPLRAVLLDDGTRVEMADPAEVEALTLAAAAANRNCNSACDGTDPNHRWTPPGGQSNWYTCADDAITVHGVRNEAPMSGFMVELRYSPQCRSAWARGDRARNFTVESYSGSSLRTRANWWVPGGPTPSGKTWTAMVNDKGYTARACSAWYHADPRSQWACTAKY